MKCYNFFVLFLKNKKEAADKKATYTTEIVFFVGGWIDTGLLALFSIWQVSVDKELESYLTPWCRVESLD